MRVFADCHEVCSCTGRGGWRVGEHIKLWRDGRGAKQRIGEAARWGLVQCSEAWWGMEDWCARTPRWGEAVQPPWCDDSVDAGNDSCAVQQRGRCSGKTCVRACVNVWRTVLCVCVCACVRARARDVQCECVLWQFEDAIRAADVWWFVVMGGSLLLPLSSS